MLKRLLHASAPPLNEGLGCTIASTMTNMRSVHACGGSGDHPPGSQHLLSCIIAFISNTLFFCFLRDWVDICNGSNHDLSVLMLFSASHYTTRERGLEDGRQFHLFLACFLAEARERDTHYDLRPFLTICVS